MELKYIEFSKAERDERENAILDQIFENLFR